MDGLRKLDLNTAKSSAGDSESVYYREGLTPSQEGPVIALIECRSIVEAAQQTQVGESSLRRWLNENSEVKRSLRRDRAQSLPHATVRLKGAASEAVNHLRTALADDKHIEPGRATLIRIAIDFASKTSAHIDFVERLEALEQEGPTSNPPANLHNDRGQAWHRSIHNRQPRNSIKPSVTKPPRPPRPSTSPGKTPA